MGGRIKGGSLRRPSTGLYQELRGGKKGGDKGVSQGNRGFEDNQILRKVISKFQGYKGGRGY